MPAAPQGITVEPNGQSVVVTLTEQGGGSPTAYANRHGTATIAMPATITTRTTFFLADATSYTVSCKVGGLENANGSGGTTTVDLSGGGVASVGVGVPVETDTIAKGTYAPLPAQAKNPLTGMYHSSGWVTGDRVDLTDGAITSGQAIFTSTSAAFVSGDIGKRVVVFGAGSGGGPLSTTILSRQSATQVTLAASASTTVSGVTASYGTDNTTLLQAWLTAVPVGGKAHLDPFHHLTSSALIISKAKVHVGSPGRDVATIRGTYATNGNNAGYLQINASDVVIDGIGICGMGEGPLQVAAVNIGNNTGTAGSYKNVVVKNSHLFDVAGHGVIGQQEAQGTEVFWNLIERVGSTTGGGGGPDGHGVSVVGNSWIVQDNVIKDCRVRGVEIFGGSVYGDATYNNIVSQNLIVNCGQYGIVTSASHDDVITDNIVYSCGTTGTYSGIYSGLGATQYSYNVKIKNNIVRGCTDHGISVDTASNAYDVSGNTSYLNLGWGVVIGGGDNTKRCTNFEVGGNYTWRNRGGGIIVQQTDRINLPHNMCGENGYGGSANSTYGVWIYTNVTNVSVVGGHYWDDQATKTQRVGVYQSETTTTGVIVSNVNALSNGDSGYDIILNTTAEAPTVSNNKGRTYVATTTATVDPLGTGFVGTADPRIPYTLPTWPTANKGLAGRNLLGGGPINYLMTHVSVSSGNACFGAYTNTGSGSSAAPLTRKATTGSVPCPATGVNAVSLGATVTVNYGEWLAMEFDNTTAAASTLVIANGVMSQGLTASLPVGFPLPASASGSGGSTYCPVIRGG